MAGEVGRDTGRHIAWLFEKGIKKPHGAELHREAQPHVVPTLDADQVMVGVVQIEMSRELVRARPARVAAIEPLLLGGESG